MIFITAAKFPVDDREYYEGMNEVMALAAS